MSYSYKGYTLFNDVANVSIRTWNRCATFFTIIQDHNIEMAKEYTKQLDDIGKKQMLNMIDEIKQNGYEVTKKKVAASHTTH